jgi:hypothetical protein
VLESSDERAMTSWTVAGQIVGEAGPGLWVRVKRVLMPDGGELPLHEDPTTAGEPKGPPDPAACRPLSAGAEAPPAWLGR